MSTLAGWIVVVMLVVARGSHAPRSTAPPIVSDDFTGATLNSTVWTFICPDAAASYQMSGTDVLLSVPPGSDHEPWQRVDQTARLMQAAPDRDFEVEVKFDSAVTNQYQLQGILVEQDPSNYLSFEIYHDGTTPQIRVDRIVASVPSVEYSAPEQSGGAPFWMRVSRSGTNWTQSWSTDGENYTVAAQFADSMSVSAIGPYGGNGGSDLPAPPFTAAVDYFIEGSKRLPNRDGGEQDFERFVIDPNPPAAVLEKALGDIDGDGRLDAVIGLSNPDGQGIYWYEQPHSGNPADPWLKHTIAASGLAYEDMVVYDVNGDGAPDVIAALNGPVYWFENPRGSGGNPASDPWKAHFIGSGSGENTLAVADLDGDGKPDVVTSAFIAFQNGPDSWTIIRPNEADAGVALLDIGSGNGAINIVSTGPFPYPTVWLENPAEHGGNPREDPWIVHTIGPPIGPTNTADAEADTTAAIATADLNGDGRVDVITANKERIVVGPVSGLVWWEAPADRRAGTWIPHMIDPEFMLAHKIAVGDMNNDGTIDIVTAEQDQTPLRRVAVFFNDGTGNFSRQILGYEGGHNLTVGDVLSNGRLDILNAPHGYYGGPHAIEVWINHGRAIPSSTIPDLTERLPQ
jgi:hypothetical protein